MQAIFQVASFQNGLPLIRTGKERAGRQISRFFRIRFVLDVAAQLLQRLLQLGLKIGLFGFVQLFQRGGRQQCSLLDARRGQMPHSIEQRRDDGVVAGRTLYDANSVDAVGGSRHFVAQFDASQAVEGEVRCAVGTLHGRADEADARHRLGGFVGRRGTPAGDRKHPASFEHIGQHFAVSRLKDVKRERFAGKKDGVGQRHDGYFVGQFHREQSRATFRGYKRQMRTCQNQGHVCIMPDLMKTPLVIFAIVLLALAAIWLKLTLDKETVAAAVKQEEQTVEISRLGNSLQKAENQLGELTTVNDALKGSIVKLEKDVNVNSNKFHKASMDLTLERNKLASKSAELDKTTTELSKTKAQLTATTQRAVTAEREIVMAKQEISKRDQKITLLQTEAGNLTEQIGELQGNIQKLSQDIQTKEKELADSMGDREFLITELKRLQQEKAELEKQLNDLAFLREQVKDLKQQLSVKRRLELIRKGIFGGGPPKRGGQRLWDKDFAPITRSEPKSFSLEVEVTRDGEVKVAPPKPPSR
jgi:predicted  nucleic acid-binding Zn-ribbon protein